MNNTANQFSTEFELVETLKLSFFELSPYKNFEYLLEHNSKNGIADLVLYRLKQSWNKQIGLKFINPDWAFALKCLPYRKSFSLNEFSDYTNSSKRIALNALKDYEIAGYCKQSFNNNWIKIKQPKTITRDVIAIEAKLKDWKKAFKQAYRYKDFANQSWVFLDKKHSEPAINNIDKFINYQIGLASISPNKNIEIIYSPPRKQPRSAISEWHTNTKILQEKIYS